MNNENTLLVRNLVKVKETKSNLIDKIKSVPFEKPNFKRHENTSYLKDKFVMNAF